MKKMAYLRHKCTLISCKKLLDILKLVFAIVALCKKLGYIYFEGVKCKCTTENLEKHWRVHILPCDFEFMWF